MKDTLQAYYRLTKPGIIQGNAIHTLAGVLLASTTGIDWLSLLGVLVGTSFVIGSACVANNYMDRGIDAKMARTKRRASVTGRIPLRHGMVFSLVLLVIGFGTLYFLTNPLVMLIGMIAYLSYVFAYGWAKRHTVHSTIVGAVPGALPAMAGYVASSGEMSVAAWLVFLLIFIWQMPHFYAISIFRKQEYAAAGIPVMGVVRPFQTVRRYIFVYLVLYLLVVVLLIATQVVGPVTGLMLLAGAVYWMVVFLRKKTTDEAKWARSVFGASLILSLLLVVASVVNVFVPPLV